MIGTRFRDLCTAAGMPGEAAWCGAGCRARAASVRKGTGARRRANALATHMRIPSGGVEVDGKVRDDSNESKINLS